MTWDAGISDPHRSIAASTRSRIGVLAGPGTGKTGFGLMRRVARLLEEGTRGDRILLLSFTRVAAADLRDKVAQLESPGIENVKATTLHGYCFGLLKRESVLTITGRTPRILLAHEVDLMLRDIGGAFGSIHDRRRLLEVFVAAWARGIEDQPVVAGTNADREFELAIQTWLREHRAMLIGEVVLAAYRYLATNPEAIELGAFDHVIADEYQDLNVLEQRLLDTLAERGALCVAGDDDQSIYSVRHANPEGILSFLKRDDVQAFTINICRRCPESVLAIANSLIRQAPGRVKDDLLPCDDIKPGTVAIVQWSDVNAEVDGIASNIAADIGSGRREPGDVLVLTNWRKLGERIRSRLAELEIPARSYFTEEELASDEGRAALALLRLVVDPSDSAAIRVLVGLGDSTGRSDAYRRLLAVCRSEAQSPANVLSRLRDGERLDVTVPALVQRFAQAIAKVEQMRGLELAGLVDALFPEDQGSTAELRSVALIALVEATNPEGLLRAILESVTQEDVPQHPDFVRVMSLHKSKGLTSPSVIVAGAIDGVLPTIPSDDLNVRDRSISEGRRLFYVAVTRAADELLISSASSMDLADANARGVRYDRRSIRRSGTRFTVRTLASPYIAELGPSAPRPKRGQSWLGRSRG